MEFQAKKKTETVNYAFDFLVNSDDESLAHG